MQPATADRWRAVEKAAEQFKVPSTKLMRRGGAERVGLDMPIEFLYGRPLSPEDLEYTLPILQERSEERRVGKEC